MSTMAPSMNQLPVVNITSPGNNCTIIAPKNITILADATDLDRTISKVEFYSGNNKLGDSYTFPYSIQFECTKAGIYEITSIATDNLNAVSSFSFIPLYATLYNNPDVINHYPNPTDGQITISLVN